MRVNSSSSMKKSVVRIAVAMLLASTVAGCSSDATRFSGLFSNQDNLTTASIPQRQGSGGYGREPVPMEDVGTGSNSGYQQPRNVAQNQPPAYPASNPSGGYAAASPARSAAAPASVQRVALAAPSAAPAMAAAQDPRTRQEALSQPMPGAAPQTLGTIRRPTGVDGDKVVTGSTPATGWSSAGAPRITVRPGETAATLSKRYGVPEREILRANGGALTAGQIAVIPTFAAGGNAAKNAAGNVDLSKTGDTPAPAHQQQDKVAMLPTPAARDKAQVEAAKVTPPAGGPKPNDGKTYTVKAGDTLAKIARATNTPIDQLKAANGISDGNIRIGQTLKVGGAGDDMKTASIPHAAPVAPKAETAAAKPQQPAASAAVEKPADKAPVQTASLSEVEKKSDVNVAAPSATGIGKYRWPVTGAVIASYGQNVDGNRNDGIDISVPEGTPIKAAENGVVIYAGNGLKQLGNTVLVRHDDGKVTVYGHAANISVSRGQKIQRGQTIATSGMSGDAKRPQVHFEVRKDASPVNPMTFLE